MTRRASFVLIALVMACGGSSSGGGGGSAGIGGGGGAGGADPCEPAVCEGECLDGVCAPLGAFPCTEQGLRDAVAQGGGPHFFACDGPTTIATEVELIVDDDVVLDGRGELTVTASGPHVVFAVKSVTAELRGVGFMGSGGAVPVTPVIENDGTLAATNATVSTAFLVNNGMLTVTDSVFLAGSISNYGTLTVANSTFSQPDAIDEGENPLSGVFNRRGATASLTDTSFVGNPCEPVENIGAMTITSCTIANNGNGCLGLASIVNDGTLTVTNSTVSGNAGRGIWNSAADSLTVTNSTVSGNADTGIYSQGTLTVTGSLIAGACAIEGETATSVSVGYNLESPLDTCGLDHPTDQVNIDPEALKLGPLQDNGGPTQTHALLPGSVAIDAIPAGMCQVDEDQRGDPRPDATICDVGAFEVQQ